MAVLGQTQPEYLFRQLCPGLPVAAIQADLKAPLDGYFLQIGGAEDSVIFYRQDSLETYTADLR
ncbi:MAG: hypothetical protein MZV49_05060 [Rhodopseudomonas palustris]|nr:hypothetical protein [Rhodopseudomonas palustris]